MLGLSAIHLYILVCNLEKFGLSIAMNQITSKLVLSNSNDLFISNHSVGQKSGQDQLAGSSVAAGVTWGVS